MTSTIRYVEEGDVIYINEKGDYHREDGPAIIFDNVIEQWHFNGKLYSKEEHPFNVFRKEYNLSKKFEEWSIEMKVLFKIIYG